MRLDSKYVKRTIWIFTKLFVSGLPSQSNDRETIIPAAACPLICCTWQMAKTHYLHPQSIPLPLRTSSSLYWESLLWLGVEKRQSQNGENWFCLVNSTYLQRQKKFRVFWKKNGLKNIFANKERIFKKYCGLYRMCTTTQRPFSCPIKDVCLLHVIVQCFLIKLRHIRQNIRHKIICFYSTWSCSDSLRANVFFF